MLKDPYIARYSTRRTHRTYTPEFKAELVAACQKPGTSIAALASNHAMNANVLHRWLEEHERGGRHRLIGMGPSGVSVATSPAPAFIPLKLPTLMPESRIVDLKIELRKGALSMTITWPVSAAADFASWTAAILK